MGKAGYGTKSLKWMIGSALTLMALPLNVLSRPLPYGLDKTPYGYSANALLYSNRVISNQEAQERNDDDRYNSLLGKINELFYYLKNNFLNDKVSALNATQIIAEQTLTSATRLNFELNAALNPLEHLNNGTFVETLKNLNQNITELAEHVSKLGASHQAQLGILQNLTEAFKQNSTSALEFFQNNATAIFAHFTQLTNDYINAQKTKETWDIGMTAANLILTGAMIISAYTAYRKINAKLDAIEVREPRLLENK